MPYKQLDQEKAKATQFKPGQSGNPSGPKPGYKHINTWVQELMVDEEFEAMIQEGYTYKEFKGAPIKAVIKAQIKKAVAGDTRAYDALVRSGWAQKVEQENTHVIITPIMALDKVINAVPGNDSNEQDKEAQQAD